MTKWAKVILLVIGILLIGFMQERVKVNINFILEKSTNFPNFFNLPAEQRIEVLAPLKKQGNFDYYYSHGNIQFLYTMDLTQLKALKWLITGISVLVHLLINILLLRIFNCPKIHFKMLYFLSAFILMFALSSQLLGTLLNLSSEFYPITRGLMGILQTPILGIIFLMITNFIANGKYK
jgi:hypothetical protein